MCYQCLRCVCQCVVGCINVLSMLKICVSMCCCVRRCVCQCVFVYVNVLSMCVQPTNPSRGWLINPVGKNPGWTVIAAIIPALLAVIRFFMDQQITAVIINRKENKLRVWWWWCADLLVVVSSSHQSPSWGVSRFCLAQSIGILLSVWSASKGSKKGGGCHEATDHSCSNGCRLSGRYNSCTDRCAVVPV